MISMLLQICFLILPRIQEILRNKLYKAENSYIISSTPTAFLQNHPLHLTLNAKCCVGFQNYLAQGILLAIVSTVQLPNEL